MSRIGKQPIALPEKTSVTLDDAGVIAVAGPLGTLSRTLHTAVSVTLEDGAVSVAPSTTSKLAYALWGTFAAHLNNMVRGVNQRFEKKLVVEGVGFRVEVSGVTLTLNLGFSHPVVFTVPQGLEATVERNVITIAGIDKDQVGQFAATVRAVKKPEPYKGKGIRYEHEVVRRKQGKKSA